MGPEPPLGAVPPAVPRYDLPRWTPVTPAFPGQISPDGRTWWDGRQWAWLAQPAAPLVVMPVARRSGLNVWQGLGIGCLALLGIVVVLAIIGVAVHHSGSVNSGCSPTPCAVADGLSVSISAVENVAPDELAQPQAGMHFVQVTVVFSNGSSSDRTVNPFDFTYRDPTGVRRQPSFFSPQTCSDFDFATIARGSKLTGQVCFEVGGDASAAGTLVWDPSSPYTGGSLTIPLRPPSGGAST